MKKHSDFIPVALLSAVLLMSSNAFADGGRYRAQPHGAWGPSFWCNFSVPLPFGTVVGRLPDQYRTVHVDHDDYYYGYHHWYRHCDDGYIIVEEPVREEVVVVDKSGQHDGDTSVVNIPNADGSFTPVKLVKRRDGYLGPQGEFYKEHPTVAELKTLYGH